MKLVIDVWSGIVQTLRLPLSLFEGEPVSDQERDEISEQELRQRVLYAMFLPVIRLARVFGVPLSQLRDWLEIAYFHELRRDDLKLREASALMGISMSKAAVLSRQLKENFLAPEQEPGLERRIEFMLWAEPLTLAKIHQVLVDVSEREVSRALAGLVKSGRLKRERRGAHTVYALNINTSRRAWDSWLARVDGLQDALGSVTNAVYGRFFRAEPRAFARTLTFRIRPEDLDELRKLYEEVIFPKIVELDDRALGPQDDAQGGSAGQRDAPDEDTQPLSLSMFWAPHEYIKHVIQEGAGDEDDRE